jgi:hypothetical protein
VYVLIQISKIKTLDELEDKNMIKEAFESKEFKEAFTKQVEKDTWDNDLPKVYMDYEGYLVHHWKDGKIDKIKKLK